MEQRTTDARKKSWLSLQRGGGVVSIGLDKKAGGVRAQLIQGGQFGRKA